MRAQSLNLLDKFHALNHIAENDMSSIKPRGLDSGDKELGTIGVGACIGHREDSGSSVLQNEVFVGEFLTIDGLATSAIVVREVSALEHEIGDYAVECGALVAEALLARAQRTKVFARLWSDICSQLQKINTF